MSDRTEDAQNLALGAVAGLIALVVAGVITLAIWRQGAPQAAPGRPTAAVAPASTASREMPAGSSEMPMASAVEKLYFEVGSAAMPADAGEVLARVAERARANAGATVLISGFHDAAGDPLQNAELAKNRALAVRHALEANGVAPAQLQMSKPAVTTGAGDAREARRVELTLQ